MGYKLVIIQKYRWPMSSQTDQVDHKLWLIQEDSSEVRFMLEGLWPDQAIYDEIHNHQLYTDAWENFDFDWEGMTRYEYHRFTLVK